MRTWSSRSIGSKLQHQFFYTLIRLGGQWLAYSFVYPVVAYYMIFRPDQRAKTRFYLSRRFPGHTGWQAFKDSFFLTVSLAKVLVDRAMVGILGPEVMRADLDLKDEVTRLVSEGKGFILLNAHVGGWQVAMSAIDFLTVPVNMLMKREEGDIDRHYYEHRGQSCPYRNIDPEGFLGGALEMIQALKQGEVLCIMGDRVFGEDKNTLAVDFLGGQVRFPISPYKIASVTQTPIAVLFSHKIGSKHYKMKLMRVIRVPAGLHGLEAFRPYVEDFAAVLERFTQEHPFEFFNFFDMWAEAPELG